jgi:hypothetical protein
MNPLAGSILKPLLKGSVIGPDIS